MEDKTLGILADAAVQPLAGAGNDAVARFHGAVDASVSAGPVGMLAEEADPSGHEDVEVVFPIIPRATVARRWSR